MSQLDIEILKKIKFGHKGQVMVFEMSISKNLKARPPTFCQDWIFIKSQTSSSFRQQDQ